VTWLAMLLRGSHLCVTTLLVMEVILISKIAIFSYTKVTIEGSQRAVFSLRLSLRANSWHLLKKMHDLVNPQLSTREPQIIDE